MDTRNLILSRMQRLMCLGLEGQPGGDLIEGTATIWVERLHTFEPSRLNAAFDSVEASATRWPTPGYIIDCIPPYQRPISTVLGNGSLPVECEPSPEARERVRALIAPLAEKLGVKL